jgi:uncharacterized membrane protein YoaK (UPF0700 family)
MTHFQRREQALAICLSALAGYVDAIGFLKAGGFFVSFMSGNSTRLAVGLVAGTPPAAVAAGLIGAFVLGVMAGTTVAEYAKGWARPVLLIVAVLLGLAGITELLGFEAAGVYIAAAAMGAENATFTRGGEVQIGLTYMTGTLVRIGQRLAFGILGKGWSGLFPFILLWLGLIGGATIGVLVYRAAGLLGLLPGALFALLLAAMIPRNGDAVPTQQS